MKHTFIRGCLALVMAAGLALTATTTAPAAESRAAAACPSKGTRFMTGSGPEIYLVGPGDPATVDRLFWVPDMTTYYRLWGSLQGIQTLPGVLNCWSGRYALTDAHLVQAPGRPEVYIWDASEGFRLIVSWDIFAGRYHFDPAKIVPTPQETIDQVRGPNWI